MKRKITIIMTALASLIVFAQDKMIFHLNWNDASFDISDIDTVRFSGGDIIIEGKNNVSYSLNEVDSATFDLKGQEMALEGDTVFVTYNGSSVIIDNPYSNISASSNGSNVNIISSANVKGIVYYISGSCSDGSFCLTPDRGYILTFDNFEMKNSTFLLNDGLDEESYTATVYLRGSSSISDSNNNSNKGAFTSKSKLKIYNDFDTEGSLSISGMSKHALNSSKRIEIYSGDLIIAEAQGDGINADGVELYGGNLSVSNTLGDCIDCSELVYIEGGTLDLNVSADDVKGVKCDSLIQIIGGNINIDVNGAGSKAIKSSLNTEISGGECEFVLNSVSPFVGEDNDYAYNAAISSNSDILVSSNAKIKISGDAIASKGFNADNNVIISGGNIELDLNGLYYDESINKDTATVIGIKAENNVEIANGNVILKIGSNAKASKGIKAENVYISGGVVNIENNGGYFSTNSSSSSSSQRSRGFNQWGGGGSSSSTVNSTVSKAIKGDKAVEIVGGEVIVNVPSGKGITCDELITLGTENGSDSDYSLLINAGQKNETTYSKSGENSRTKYTCSPKGINCDGNVVINCGTIDVTSYDTGIKGKYLTVNGGKITVWASIDQGLHGEYELTINGGDILVSASYEALESIKMTFNGGVTSCYASDDVWNGSTGSTGANSSPSITINGGYHYLKISGSGDTDVIDSNGSLTFTGGVTICETGSGSTLDCDGTKTFSNTNNPIIMLFGGSTECVPDGNTISNLKISNISANTRYSIAVNNQVNSSFTTTQTASYLMYFAQGSPTFYSGGTLNGAKDVAFRTNNNSTVTYSYGGSISGGTVNNNTSSTTTSGSGGGGGGGRMW